jgi:flagellar basal-body rod protein FlgB
VFIGDVLNSGAIPSLEATLRFSGERHRLIAHNIANLSTPGFQPKDVSPATFQAALRDAIERRREPGADAAGDFQALETREISQTPDGRITLNPTTPSGNILFHDRNDRDLERLMQDHAENAGVYRLSADLLRSRYAQIREALAERV